MVTRREFHKGMMALALANLAVGRAAMAATGENTDLLYLNRLTFGATTANKATFSKMGLSAWLDAELAKPIMDSALEQRINSAELWIEYEDGESDTDEPWSAIAEMRPLQYLNAEPADLVKFLDFDQPFDFAERERPGQEVIAASYIRAVHADAQLREVMTVFWHDHFNVNALKDEATAIFFPGYDNIMRRNAFGNFRTFLGEVARAPSMLFYLNNEASRASPANENYARELLELHTLGDINYLNDKYDNWHDVPGADTGNAVGYIDQDVYEVARAFTGWTVGDGRWIDDGADAPKTGTFYYSQAWHDPYQKRILAHEFEANSAPMADGDKVLDILAVHPGTAQFVTQKMIRRLGIETPSDAYQKRIADVFLNTADAPDQLAQVIRAIVLDDEFAKTPADKLRRPFEFLIALFRASGTEITNPPLDLTWALEKTGWTQHQVAPPTGHSDHSIDWANTRALNGLVEFALYAHDGWYEGLEFDYKTTGATTWREFATHWTKALSAPDEAVAAFLEGMELDFDEPLTTDDEYLAWGANNAIAMAALTPEFMFR